MSAPKLDLQALEAPGQLASTPGDVYELVVRCRAPNENQVSINVFHLLAVTPNCTANAIIVEWRTYMETTYRKLFASGMQIERYLCFNLVPFQTDVAEQTVSLVGTAASGMLPTVCAAVFTWRTGLLGRRHRGRTYIGGLSTADVGQSRINGASITGNYNPWGNAMIARWGAGGSSPDIRMGVWSRVVGGQSPPHNPAGLTIIQSFVVQPNVATMGTRRVGRGM